MNINNVLEEEIVTNFMSKYRLPRELKLIIKVTNNINKDVQNHMKKYNKEDDYISHRDFNGMICTPNNINEETLILLNYEKAINYENNKFEIMRTLFHELIHAKDYYNYYKTYFDGKYDSSHHRDSTYGFTFWSEFNAKKISCYEYRKLCLGDKIKSQDNKKYIISNELPHYNKEIDKLLKDSNSYMEDIIYNIMFYLGRYSVWEELFPEVFANSQKFSKELAKYKPVVDELYILLKKNSGKMSEYEEIKRYINLIKGRWVNITSHIN